MLRDDSSHRRSRRAKETHRCAVRTTLRTAAEVLVDQLRIHGVRHVFCVPGESYLAVLDAFHDSDLAVTVCRQEGGAAMMAEAVGKATGRPGVCFVTRGPGATNASPGIHIARQDSTPLVMFVGQVARDMREREAFQELDYRAVFGSMTKWATEIDDPARVPEIVSRAFYTAANGRPGPVVVSLPEDMLTERIAVDDAPPFAPVETSPGAAEMAKFAQLLGAARAPILILGGSRWSQAASDSVGALRAELCAAGLHDVPPLASLRRAASLLRRRSRHRPQPEAPGADQVRRSGCADRRAAGRIAVAELHAVRYSAAADDFRACASGRRRTRPRLQPASADPRDADGVCRRARAR